MAIILFGAVYNSKPLHNFKVGDKVKIPTKKTVGNNITSEAINSSIESSRSVGYAVINKIYSVNCESVIDVEFADSDVWAFRYNDLELYDPEEEKKALFTVIEVGDEVQGIRGRSSSPHIIGTVTQVSDSMIEYANISFPKNLYTNKPENLTIIKKAKANTSSSKKEEFSVGRKVSIMNESTARVCGFIFGEIKAICASACKVYPTLDVDLQKIYPNGIWISNIDLQLEQTESLSFTINNNQSKTNHHVKAEQQSKPEPKSLLSSIDRSKVSERRIERGVGLKSVGIKGKLGSNNRHY